MSSLNQIFYFLEYYKNVRGRARFVNYFKTGPYTPMLPLKKRKYEAYATPLTRPLILASPSVKRPRTSPRVDSRVNKGFTRTGGFYGRFGANARNLGIVPEMKFKDTTIAFSIDTTGEIPATGQLALIAQGDTESTRDGRQCNIRSIQVRLALVATPVASATFAGTTTIYLIQDTQANGAAAGVTDVFTGTNLPTALLNLANSSRFRILKKWKHNWGASAGVSGAYNNTARYIDWYKKCNIPMEFSSTTGAITEIKSNNIFLMAGTTAPTALDDAVDVAGQVRLRFIG